MQSAYGSFTDRLLINNVKEWKFRLNLVTAAVILHGTVVWPAREGNGVLDVVDVAEQLQVAFQAQSKAGSGGASEGAQLQVPVETLRGQAPRQQLGAAFPHTAAHQLPHQRHQQVHGQHLNIIREGSTSLLYHTYKSLVGTCLILRCGGNGECPVNIS